MDDVKGATLLERRARLVAAVLVAAVLVLAGCGGDDDDEAAVATTGTTAVTTPADATTSTSGEGGPEIEMRLFQFQPAMLEVEVGDEVTVRNVDDTFHTWTSTDGAWDSGQLGHDASFSHTFTEAGTFPFVCAIHPSMKGTVQVS